MKHIHHIVPKHMGGDDSSDNLMEITIAEHAEEHRKLYQKYGKHEDYVAWKGLSAQIGKEEIFFETSKIGGLNNKGKVKSKEHRNKISEIRKTQTWDTETKEKIGNSMKGNKNSKNHNSKKYKRTQSKAMREAWARRKAKGL